jgi:guanine nucleotide-binding protein subunit alpha
MRIIHSGGFPEDERRQNRAVIYSNLVVAFKVLMEIMQTQKIEFEKESNKVGPLLSLYIFAANVVSPSETFSPKPKRMSTPTKHLPILKLRKR